MECVCKEFYKSFIDFYQAPTKLWNPRKLEFFSKETLSGMCLQLNIYKSLLIFIKRLQKIVDSKK